MSETDFQEAIKQHILVILSDHRGEGDKVSRQELLRQINQYQELAGLPLTHDRYMRSTIEYLRVFTMDGAWICSTLRGGYYLASTPVELNEYLKNEMSRMKKLAKRISRQRRVAGQLTLRGE